MGEGATKNIEKAASDGGNSGVPVTESDAAKLASVYSDIVSKCQKHKAALQACSSDVECRNAFMGFTVCAGKYMCPLQHKSFVESLKGLESAEMDEAFEVLSECVSACDERATRASLQFPELFD